jgi:hypothetical protein
VHKKAQNYNWGYADANEVDVLAETLHLFTIGATAADERMIP